MRVSPVENQMPIIEAGVPLVSVVCRHKKRCRLAPLSLYNAAVFSGAPMMVDDIELNRLFWHSRRGMLELDVLLVPFVREVYAQLDAEDQARYRKLLACEDQDMFGWFMQREEPEDLDLRRMVKMILDRVQPK